MFTAPITREKLALAYRYANTRKNAAKRRYANIYIGWLQNGAVGTEPEHPGLGAMGAQSVRFALDDMKLWE